MNPGVVSTEAFTATLGGDAKLAQRYGAMPPEAIAQALLWLATSAQAPGYAKGKGMLELQEIAKNQGFAGEAVATQ